MSKKLITFPILIVILFLVVYFHLGGNIRTSTIPLEQVNDLSTKESNMKIASSAFSDRQSIPAKYTCDGADVNPPLDFEGLPEGTESLVLIIDDPDAPMGTWVHWVVFNISPDETGIKEDSVPKGALLGTTDFGDPSYGGPCPPSGTHRYFFKLYALDSMLDMPEGTTKEELLTELEDHILGYAELVGLYER